MIGWLPSKLFQQFERNRFLPLDSVRIHGIEQIYRHPLNHFIEHTHAAIKISFELAGNGSVVERLRKLAPGNLPVRNQHQAVQPPARRICGH